MATTKAQLYMMGWRRGAIGLTDKVPNGADGTPLRLDYTERAVFAEGYKKGCGSRNYAEGRAKKAGC